MSDGSPYSAESGQVGMGFVCLYLGTPPVVGGRRSEIGEMDRVGDDS